MTPESDARPNRGSSPLTRGKRFRVPGSGAAGGLIPAHAGKTAFSRVSSWRASAHPRSRGENWVGSGEGEDCAGSSPLTRGKLTPHHPPKIAQRLIPAHAGKTSRMMKSGSDKAAHPRSRGENSGRRFRSRLATGSSPLTRGKRVPRRRWDRDGGLIPAHAGKTIGVIGFICGSPAHPRSRGENHAGVTSPQTLAGSSPLTRGKLA